MATSDHRDDGFMQIPHGVVGHLYMKDSTYAQLPRRQRYADRKCRRSHSKSPISRSSAALDHKHRNNYNAIINYRSKLEEPNTTSGCYNRPYKHYCTITLGFHPFHPWQWHMFCLLGGRYKQKVRAYPPHVRRYWWKYSKHILYTTPQIRVIRSLFSIPVVEYQHPR